MHFLHGREKGSVLPAGTLGTLTRAASSWFPGHHGKVNMVARQTVVRTLGALPRDNTLQMQVFTPG